MAHYYNNTGVWDFSLFVKVYSEFASFCVDFVLFRRENPIRGNINTESIAAPIRAVAILTLISPCSTPKVVIAITSGSSVAPKKPKDKRSFLFSSSL